MEELAHGVGSNSDQFPIMLQAGTLLQHLPEGQAEKAHFSGAKFVMESNLAALSHEHDYSYHSRTLRPVRHPDVRAF